MPDFKPLDPVRYTIPASYFKKRGVRGARACKEESVVKSVSPSGIITTAAGHTFDKTGLFRGLSDHERHFGSSQYRLELWGPAERLARRRHLLVARLAATRWQDLPLETLEAVNALLHPSERTLPLIQD